MSLGSNLYNARKKSGLSQEAVAEKLGVSRQTVSKWETDETLPDIRQSKRLAVLYRLTLDELVDTGEYSLQLERLLRKLSADYGYSDLDSFLVLKDILAQLWNGKKSGPK